VSERKLFKIIPNAFGTFGDIFLFINPACGRQVADAKASPNFKKEKSLPK